MYSVSPTSSRAVAYSTTKRATVPFQVFFFFNSLCWQQLPGSLFFFLEGLFFIQWSQCKWGSNYQCPSCSSPLWSPLTLRLTIPALIFFFILLLWVQCDRGSNYQGLFMLISAANVAGALYFSTVLYHCSLLLYFTIVLKFSSRLPTLPVPCF